MKASFANFSWLTMSAILIVLFFASSPQAAEPEGLVQASNFKADIQPLLSQYCFRCHGNEKQKADLTLETYQTANEARQDREVWQKVLQVLDSREMPPEGKPSPTTAEYRQIQEWIRSELFPVECDQPDPGRVTIRRLNRAEYNHTIRDLVGIDFHPADDFPADDSGYGFDNIGDVLSLSPLLLEKYLAAAEKIMDAALLIPESIQLPAKTYSAREFKTSGGGGLVGDCCFKLHSQGEVSVRHAPSQAGQYQFRISAYGEPAGPEPPRLVFKLNGKTIHETEVKAREASPEWYDVKVELKAGPQQLAGAFVNDYHNPNDSNPANRDRNLVIQSFQIIGPLDAPVPPLPETHRRIFVCQPETGQEADCARTIIERFTRRAFRRPISQSELDRLASFAALARQEGESFEQSIKLALEAVLVSPHFLFRGELQPEPNNPHSAHPINEFALASRLSYFLWSSMPDDELYLLAEQGKLRQNLDTQVQRMLKDPKALALAENFTGQWLQTRNLILVNPDAKEFPAFSAELRSDMRRETDLLTEAILREDRSVLEFLTAEFTYVNERLARHYGLSGVKGQDFRRVSLKGTPRGGVLTHASVLTITSNPTRTSPVKRGKWVLENLLNAPPPPPPPNVPELAETSGQAASGTLRQRMELHREDPTCASCHALMDPIGFGLENFDGVGAWRDKDGAFPVDPSGELNTGETFAGAAELRLILATQKREAFARCLAEKMLTYALGRGIEFYDQCAIDRIVERMAQGQYRFSVLIQELVNSVPFQMRRGEGDRLAQAR